MRNQYFQLEFRDINACLHIYPPQEGGAMLNIAEVTEYLASKKYEKYDIKELNAAIKNADEETIVVVGNWDGIPVRESIEVNVSLDKMKVVCRFYPPSVGGAKLQAEDILSDLAFHKVKYGVNEEVLKEFLGNRKYCTDYMIAAGQPPVHGTDAKIEYFLNTNKNP